MKNSLLAGEHPSYGCLNVFLGCSRKSPSQLLGRETYPSTFHTTPKRRRFSKDEWEKFTTDSTEKALEELVSSPNFGKWLYKNADRITVEPNTARAKHHRKWLFWSSD